MRSCLDKTFPFQFLVFKKSLHGIRQNAHWITRTLFGKKMPKMLCLLDVRQKNNYA
jgi:hypothetical protein